MSDKKCSQCKYYISSKKRFCYNKAVCHGNKVDEYCIVHVRMREKLAAKNIKTKSIEEEIDLAFLIITIDNVDDSFIIENLKPLVLRKYIELKDGYEIEFDRNLKVYKDSIDEYLNETKKNVSKRGSIMKEIRKYIKDHPEKIRETMGNILKPKRPEEILILAANKKTKEVAGWVFGTMKTDNFGALNCYINFVTLSFDYQNRRLCKPLLIECCELLQEEQGDEDISYFEIDAVSEFPERAFSCYAGVGMELEDYDSYYFYNQKLVKIDSIKDILESNLDLSEIKIFFIKTDYDVEKVKEELLN